MVGWPSTGDAHAGHDTEDGRAPPGRRVASAQSPAGSSADPRTPRSSGKSADAPPDPRRLYLPTPAEEDWSFLADPKARTDPLDGIKYLPLGRDGAYLSLGGEGRVFVEHLDGENFGRGPRSDTYPEFRALLHGDLHLSRNWRVFVTTQTALIGDRTGGPRPSVDKNELDLLEGFAEYRSSAFDAALEGPALTVRVGRQQLDFGAGRLVSIRAGQLGQGANVLQGFDGVRAILRRDAWRLDVFATKPVDTRPGVFNDGWLPGQGAWGAYLTRGGPPGSPQPGFDLYYIGTTRPDAPFFSGVADETRHSIGVRAFRQGTPLAYDAELIYQFGDFGARRISAWAAALEASYTFEQAPWSPQPGIRLGADSGGGRSGALKTFYAPFPRGAYFGNLSAIGPENTLGAEGVLGLRPSRTVTIKAGVYAFWRTSLDDGVYGLAGYPLVPPTNRERYIGYQPVVQVSWQANAHLTLNAAYETFRRGDFLEAVPNTRSIDYAAAWATFRF